MKEEMKYIMLCSMMNEVDENGDWCLITNEEGILVFDGEIDEEHVQVPADFMLKLIEIKSKNIFTI